MFKGLLRIWEKRFRYKFCELDIRSYEVEGDLVNGLVWKGVVYDTIGEIRDCGFKVNGIKSFRLGGLDFGSGVWN